MDSNLSEPREFTVEELSKYNGTAGNGAYVAINGIVYDMSNKGAWSGGTHYGLVAGKDLSEQFKSCHGGVALLLEQLPKVGTLIK